MIRWLKGKYPYICATLGAVMIPYILITTPSLHQSQQKFAVMEGDLQNLNVPGSRIIYRKDVNKYGVASLSAEIAGVLVTSEDVSTLGWAAIDQFGGSYCKDGIYLTVAASDKTFLGQKVTDVNFIYNVKSIDVCKKTLSK